MDKGMEKENFITKMESVGYMMDSGLMEKLMVLEHYIMQMELLLIMDNGKTNYFMEEA